MVIVCLDSLPKGHPWVPGLYSVVKVHNDYVVFRLVGINVQIN